MLRDVRHLLLLAQHLNLLFLLFRQGHEVVEHILLVALIHTQLQVLIGQAALFIAILSINLTIHAVRIVEVAAGCVFLVEVASQLMLRRVMRYCRLACS